MRILRLLFASVAVFGLHFSGLAQEKNIKIVGSSDFNSILNEKRIQNQSSTANDRYKIQIFYGSNAEAGKKLSEFKRRYPEIDGTIIYSNPSYKVWVGSFKTRIEAERNLKLIQNHFENSLIIKPGK